MANFLTRKTFVVACIAGATMGIELVQTRVLSYLYFNHVVYLTVTIALLGFGMSGVLVSLMSTRIVAVERAISKAIALFAFSIPISMFLASSLPSVLPMMGPIYKLILSYLFLIPPFMFAGSALGLLFMSNAERMYQLYFADLAASAVGALCFVFMLQPLGAGGLIWLCVGGAFLGYVIHGWTSIRLPVLAGLGAVLFAWYFVLGSYVSGYAPEYYKTLGRYFASTTAKIEATRWTPIARIDVASDPGKDGNGNALPAETADAKLITQDSDAFTVMLGADRVAELIENAKAGKIVSSMDTLYYLNPKPDQALVIGVGGGIDIVRAKAFGADHITAVEINPATVSLLQNEYRQFAVWPAWNNVSEIRDEGRHFIRTTQTKYDTLVMSGIDTLSALSSGAYVLSENYLYTVEAMEDYLRALKPDGTAAIFRWFFPQPRETLRLANLFISAAERQGIAHPEDCIMVIAEDMGWEYRWATTLIKKRPFTPQEVNAVLQLVDGNKKLSIVYIPKVLAPDTQAKVEGAAFARDTDYLAPSRAAFANLFATASEGKRQAFEDAYPFRIDPTFDDRPFFFEYFKRTSDSAVPILSEGVDSTNLSSIRGNVVRYVLWILLGFSGLVGIISMIGPLFVFERQGLKARGAFPLILYFTSLGAGFMIVEIGFIQRLTLFLGDPMNTMATVLCGLLFFCGSGSWLAGRLGFSEETNIAVGTLATTALIPLTLAAVHFGLPALANLPLVWRAVAVLLLLSPMGFAMGFPFASGIHYLGPRYERFIPWAWGVNGLTSVLASVAAIIAAMRFGFTFVIVSGACIYLLGYFAFRVHVWLEKRAPVGTLVQEAADD
jgi:spermidine synthase